MGLVLPTNQTGLAISFGWLVSSLVPHLAPTSLGIASPALPLRCTCLDERHQWGHHDGHAPVNHGGQLVAQALAAACKQKSPQAAVFSNASKHNPVFLALTQ